MSDKPLVFVSGCFDVFTAGHLHILREAAKLGDVIVGINSDDYARRKKGENRPVDTWEVRAKNVMDTGLVEEVYWFDDDTPWEIIFLFKPKFLVVGDDYPLEKVACAEEAKFWGGQVVQVKRIPNISSTEVINKLCKKCWGKGYIVTGGYSKYPRLCPICKGKKYG